MRIFDYLLLRSWLNLYYNHIDHITCNAPVREYNLRMSAEKYKN